MPSASDPTTGPPRSPAPRSMPRGGKSGRISPPAPACMHPTTTTRLDPHALRDWLVRERITITFAATPLAEHLMTLRWPSDTALRIMLTGADTLHRYAPTGLPFTVVNNYGPTECTVVSTSGAVLLEGAERGLPAVGAPIPGVTVQVLDEAQRSVARGEIE